MLLFVDRDRRADEYPWLEWKVRLFVIGAALAVGGMVLEMDWLILVAVAFLAAGFLIRFLPGGKGVTLEEAEDGFGGEGEHGEEPEEEAGEETSDVDVGEGPADPR